MGPPFRPEIPRFPQSDFAKIGLNPPLLLGWVLRCFGLNLRLRCGNRRINHFVPMRLQCLQRRDFVNSHQTAVADDIGGKDCYETARAGSFGQPRVPKTLNQQLRV